MSIARVQSFAFAGIDAQPVEIQVQISSGLPTFLMVGLPDKAVGEARERVRAALTAMGLALPPKRVLINLAPADMLKEGSHFDLPVALAVLAAMEVLPREEIAQFAALGRTFARWPHQPGRRRAARRDCRTNARTGVDLPGIPRPGSKLGG